MSGYADLNIECDKGKQIPFVVATSDNTRHLGTFVSTSDFENTALIYKNTLYEKDSTRPIIIPQKEVTGEFLVWESENIMCAENKAVGSGMYTVAKRNNDVVYIREANYHPESSQLVCPVARTPFVLVLGSTIDNLTAYYFYGDSGFHINPGVWHQPPINLQPGTITFKDKQAMTHLCVLYDSIIENNRWLYFVVSD
jgi:hypothetical protein